MNDATMAILSGGACTITLFLRMFETIKISDFFLLGGAAPPACCIICCCCCIIICCCCISIICCSGELTPPFFLDSIPRNCISCSRTSTVRTCSNSNSRAKLSCAACDCSSFRMRNSSERLPAASIASSRLVDASAFKTPLLLTSGASSLATSSAINEFNEKETRTNRLGGSELSFSGSIFGTRAALIPFVFSTWMVPSNSSIVKPRARRCRLKRSRASSNVCLRWVAMLR